MPSLCRRAAIVVAVPVRDEDHDRVSTRRTDEDGNAADRSTVEHVLGRPTPDAWPASALPPGARVRVVKDLRWDGPWRHEFIGVIDDLGAPELVHHAQAQPDELTYWVKFDEPQLDSAGDGPYRKAQIWARYLQVVDEDDPSP